MAGKMSKMATALIAFNESMEGKLENSDETLMDQLVYWTKDDWSVRSKYASEIWGGDRYIGLLTCFYLRAVDKNKKRMFSTEEEWKTLQESTTLHPRILRIASQMIGEIAPEGGESNEEIARKN